MLSKYLPFSLSFFFTLQYVKFIVCQFYLNKLLSGFCAWTPKCAGSALTSHANWTLGENHALPTAITMLLQHALPQLLELQVPGYS